MPSERRFVFPCSDSIVIVFFAFHCRSIFTVSAAFPICIVHVFIFVKTIVFLSAFEYRRRSSLLHLPVYLYREYILSTKKDSARCAFELRSW